MEGAAYMLGTSFLELAASGREPQPIGNDQGVYPQPSHELLHIATDRGHSRSGGKTFPIAVAASQSFPPNELTATSD